MRHLAFALSLAALAAGSAAAQDVYVYPAKGQSTDQQQRDRYECHSWAVQQAGFDPSNPPMAAAPGPSQASPPAGSGLVRGAAGGAALGAIGGAIGGDAGKGAAIGAATGGAIGVVRRHRQQQASQQQYASGQASQSNAVAAGRASYNRALGACLQGRGYTVN
jgi:predicted lipid-binding transport protein (Tim44 family)